MDPDAVGAAAYELMQRLFPLCRSLTGSGVAATFDVLEEQLPLERTEIASGMQIFDWKVPDEWNIRDAYIATPDGKRVVDFKRSSLHVVSYSEPVRARMSLESLRERLHTLPDQPDVVPYRTSYYHRTWGFCLSHRQLLELPPGEYEVLIDSTLEAGHLTYAELRLDGASEEEVLISTYVCHPSLANDNLSGIAVATMLAKELSQRRLRHSYRFLFAPGTIGPLSWLHENRDTLHRIKHGLTVSCIGDAGGLTYKRSRRGDSDVDRAVELVLRESGARTALSAGSRGAATSASFAHLGSTSLSAVSCARRTGSSPDTTRLPMVSSGSAQNRSHRRSGFASMWLKSSRPIAPSRTSARSASLNSGAAASTDQAAARWSHLMMNARCCGYST